MQLNKEKFNNIKWMDYKNYIIHISLKAQFINDLENINYRHDYLIKNLLKRNIYKKYELDDYKYS